jgi:hypothetical protein
LAERLALICKAAFSQAIQRHLLGRKTAAKGMPIPSPMGIFYPLGSSLKNDDGNNPFTVHVRGIFIYLCIK